MDGADVTEFLKMAEAQSKYSMIRRGKLVTFYKNGDSFFKGLQTSVSGKHFVTQGSLLAWLNEKISTPTGVKYVFSLPDGKEIKDVTQFLGGRSYVVSSTRKIINVPYGDGRERFWSIADPGTSAEVDKQYFSKEKPKEDLLYSSQSADGSASSDRWEARTDIKHSDDIWKSLTDRRRHTTSGSQGQISSPLSFQGEYYFRAKPRVLLIVSNTDRSSQQRVLFNPRTLQTYEDVLRDIEGMIAIRFPPVTSLYTAEAPFVKVLGLSHLSRDLRNCDEFLACGREGVPLEIQPEVYKQPTARGTRRSEKPLRASKSMDYIDAGAALHVDELDQNKRQQTNLPADGAVKLFINKNPEDGEMFQISVGCQSQHCNCRLHDTLSKLLINSDLGQHGTRSSNR